MTWHWSPAGIPAAWRGVRWPRKSTRLPAMSSYSNTTAPRCWCTARWPIRSRASRIRLIERPRFHSEQAWQDYADKLTELARFTLSQGVRLAYHHHMGAYVESPEDIDQLMRRTGPEVGLLFDSGHCYMGGGEPLQVLRTHIERVCHVHFKDVRKPVVQLARNQMWSFPDCIVNGTFTVPGDGDIDFAELLDVLLAARYKGWLVVEAEQDPAVAPSYIYAKKGYDTLRALLNERTQP